MKKIPAWIVIKHDVQRNGYRTDVFKCERCHIERQVHLPAAVEDVLKQVQAFAESHKCCKG